jgi:DNA modification methylase
MSLGEHLTVEQVPLDTLYGDPGNPRRMADVDHEALERSIALYGFVQPLVVRRADRTVIAGHQRLVAARRLGLSHVPVIWVDLASPQARALGLALNKISGTWDEQLLARLVEELEALPEIDLAASGFADDEVASLLRRMETREKRDRPETFDLDTAYGQATRQPRTKPGDLWILGSHRVVCGDATRREDLGRALDRGTADMAFTDPPYNVDFGRHGGHQPGSRRRTMSNDALAPAEFEAFTRRWAESLFAVTEGAVYVCMGSRHWPTVARVFDDLGAHWSDVIVWIKNQFVIGRADYHHGYELIWYGWREGTQHQWHGGRDQSNVWQIRRPTDSPLHGVMKPLGLMERAIGNSSLTDALVLDPFLGSGGTLIACERTGRRCAAIELDPLFVDVAVARWERFTGSQARLAGAEPAQEPTVNDAPTTDKAGRS